MARIFYRFIFLSLTGFLLGGCASTGFYSMGVKHLEDKEYDLAIEAFQKAREQDPENLLIKRELGVAHYRKAEIDKALPLLIEAFLADSTDGRTLFYLGTAFESTGDFPHALDIYRRYADAGPEQGMRKAIEARLAGLIRKQMTEDAKTALRQESAFNPASISESTLAVLYFRNVGKKRDLDPIQKGLADMLITDLSKVKKLKVVERVRMQKLLDEMALGGTGLVGEPAASRLGRLLGAAKLVNGTFIDLTQENLRIDAGFVQILKGKTPASSQVQGKLARFFRMEKDLVFGLLNKLGIMPSLAERDDINIIPTENLLAFLAYCKGLDYEDKGLYQKAHEQYQQAARLDPQYEQAVQASARVDELILSEMPLPQLETMFAGGASETETAPPAQTPSGAASQEQTQQTGEGRTQEQPQEQTTSQEEPSRQQGSQVAETGLPSEAMEPPSFVVDQMMHTAGVLDQGFLPGLDSRNTTQEENQSSFGNTANFNIRVPLPQQ
jgi:tetratricopeptide (TPR) repeat protein